MTSSIQSLQPALTGLTEMSWPLCFQCACVCEYPCVCVSSCRHPEDFPSAGHSLCLCLSLSLSAVLSIHSSSPPSPAVLHIPLFSLTCSPTFKGFHFPSLNHISISFHIPPPRSLLPSEGLHSSPKDSCCIAHREGVFTTGASLAFALTLSTPPASPQLKAPYTL